MKLQDIAVAAATTLVLASANAASAACQLGKVIEFPVTMHGTRPWTTVQINGQDASFIVDSGAFFSTITPAKAAELKLGLEPAPFGLNVVGVGGSAVRLDVARVQTLTLAGIPIPRMQFLVLGQGGDGSAGLLGQNILHITDDDYDLAHGSVRLMKPRDCGRTVLAYWANGIPYNVIDLVDPENHNHHTFGHVIVNGVQLKATFDTGASGSVIKLRAAERAGLRPDMEGARSIGASSGIGTRRSSTWTVPVASFKIGDEEIKKTRIQISDIELDDSDMLLGADFFLAHHVYVALSQDKIYFTYNGGPVFNLTAPPPRPDQITAEASPNSPGAASDSGVQPPPASAGADEPKDADAYGRRGAARAAVHDYASAIADFTKAIALKPEEARFYLQRAQAHLGLKQAFLAMTDLDECLKRDPNDVDALVARAEMKLSGQDRAGAAQDLDAASAAAATQADIRIRIAQDDERSERFDKAVAELDRWIPSHLDEAQTPQAYNSRCWALANLGRDLDKALNDCNRSISGGRSAANLDSCGLVHLRRGEYDQAINDYTASLALQPRLAWSLYGRGLAHLHKGEIAAGDADIAAANAINPKLAEIARSRGIVSPVPMAPPAPSSN